MTKAMALFAAFAAAVFVTLTQWLQRTGAALWDARDIGGSIGFAALSVVLGWWLAGFLTKDEDRRGLIALITGVWAPLSASIQVLLSVHVSEVFRSPALATLVWSVFCGLLILLCSRGKSPLNFVTRSLAIATGVLLLNQGQQIVSAAARAGGGPTTPLGAVVDSTSPDVYLLVLDKYSSGAWMHAVYGVDQSAFEDSLRQLGFTVPTAARANYAHTHLSLASFLNWRYLDLAVDAEGGPPWGQTKTLIAESRTWREFRSRGYRLVTFPTWYTGTSNVANADLQLRYDGEESPRSTRIGETWLINSPFAPLFNKGCAGPNCRNVSVSPYPVETLSEQRWKLRTFASFADSAGPTFAFLHLLLPHEPYLFAEDCSPREPWWPSTDQGESGELVAKAYAAQVRCTAPLILGTVREILARSPRPPVIIIQSDHGHARIFTDLLRGFTLSSDDATQAQVGERQAVFGAYHFPASAEQIRNDGSMVNVMRAVARSMWNDTTPALPDSSFFSTYQDAFRFTVVPAAVTVPAPRRE